MEEKEILDLVTSVREGSDVAFAELVDRYTPLMNREAADFSSSAVSHDEMISEACIALHSAALTYDMSKNLTFGLYAKICIHRKLIDLMKMRRIPESDIDVEKITVTSSIDSRLAAEERFNSLLCISRSLLSDFEYRVLIFHVQGYKTAKIAEELSCTGKSVDNAKNRVFKKLREYFSQHRDY